MLFILYNNLFASPWRESAASAPMYVCHIIQIIQLVKPRQYRLVIKLFVVITISIVINTFLKRNSQQ